MSKELLDRKSIDISPSKTKDEENFPVASFLIEKRLRTHVHAFYSCVRVADDIADNPKFNEAEKTELLEKFETILLGQGSDKTIFPEAWAHLESARETNVSTQHARNLIQAFKLDAKKSRYRNWSELINYCRYSAAPVGRYLLDLHEEKSPKIYPKTDALCLALQILNHIQDCHQDYQTLDRIYIPLDLLRKEGAKPESLGSSKSTPEIRRVFDTLLERTQNLLLEACKAPTEMKNRRLRIETSVIISLAQRLNHKLRFNDPIEQPVNLNKGEKVFSFIIGALHPRGLF
ncbi:MAG: squalene/phytoene synthase family protein [Rhodospirillaceae bacterium]